MVFLILRNASFEQDLPLEEDHVYSMEIRSPRLFGRTVQSLLALERGEEPLENYFFLENERRVDGEKLLCVVRDPFEIDFAARKISTALHGQMNELIRADAELQARWERGALELAEILREVGRTLAVDIALEDSLSVQEACKALSLRVDCPQTAEPLLRLCKLMDVIAEWMPKRLLVLCNLNGYLSERDRGELMKYACYTRVRTLLIDQTMPERLLPQEIRWKIDEEYDDKILRM